MSKYLKAMTLSTALVLTLSSGVVIANPDVLQNYSVKNEDHIQQDLKLLEKDELIKEINNVSKMINSNSDVSSLIPFAAELLDRKEDISNEEVISYIKDVSNTVITRNSMVELYQVKNKGNKNNELKELLKDKSLGKEIQVKIIATSNFEKEDIPLLESLVIEDEDQLAFQAMKKLRNLDKEMALRLSDKILNDYKKYSEDKVSSALKAKSYYIKNSTSKTTVSLNSNEKDLINISMDIMNSDKYSIKLKDSAFFAVSDLRSVDGMVTILTQDNIDKELVVYAIGQNFNVFEEILLNNPSDYEIELVIKAMELNPLSDLYGSLTKVVPTIKNDELRKRAEKVLLYIKENGTYANHKWLDNIGGKQ